MAPKTSIDVHLQVIDGDDSKAVNLVVNGKKVIKGEFVAKGEAQTAPAITLSRVEAAASGVQTYIAVSLDLHAPFVSVPFLSPILHWIQPGYTASGSDDTLSTTSPSLVSWLAPSPPPGSGPHQYVVFLYEQPTEFDAQALAFGPDNKNVGLGSRIRFDLDAWEAKAGLQGKFVGGTYFMSK